MEIGEKNNNIQDFYSKMFNRSLSLKDATGYEINRYELLNSLDDLGWELVSVVDSKSDRSNDMYTYTYTRTYYFKRPLKK